MTLSKIRNATLAIVLASAAMGTAPAAAQTPTATDAGLAVETLSDGRTMQAIAQLEAELELHPGDPAVLINLGIAHAQSGNDSAARDSFEAAMRAREVVELETVNGTTTDSRRLARHAITMLERGEFRPASQRGSSQFTLRD